MEDRSEHRGTPDVNAPDFDNWMPPKERIDPSRVEVHTRMLRVEPTLALRYRQKNGE